MYSIQRSSTRTRQSRIYILKSKIPLLITALVIAAFLAPASPTPASAAGLQPALLPAPAPQDAPAAPDDTPEIVIKQPYEKYYISDGLLYWANNCYVPIPAPGEPQLSAAPDAPADLTTYYLRRKPTNGTITRTLTIFQDDPFLAPPHTCHTFWGLYSTFDGVYYYSFDANQLEFRRSGSPFDPPTVLLNNFPAGTAPNGENFSVRMAGDNANIYWVGGGNTVQRTRISGGNVAPQLVASGLTDITDILVVGQNLYITDAAGLWRIGKEQCANGGACALTVADNRLSASPGATNSGAGMTYRFEPGVTVNTAADEIYWVSGFTIRRYSCRRFDNQCTDSLIRSAPDNTWWVGAPSFSGNTMFWHEGDNDVFPDGGVLHRATIAAPISSPDDIAVNIATTTSRAFVDGNFVYFAEYEPPTNSVIERLPLTSTAITRDLKADKFEITQGIQNAANEVPLVAGKTTYVRAWGVNLAGPRANGVVAKLFGKRNGIPLPGSPLKAINGDRSLVPGTGYSRLNFYDGWLFQVPSSWLTQGTTEFRVEVDPGHSFADPNRANNELVATLSLGFQRDACAVFIPVRTHDPVPNTDFPNFWDMVGRFQRLWPIPGLYTYSTDWTAEEIDVCWWGPFPYPCGGPFELNETDISLSDPIPDKDEVIAELWAYNVVHYVPACDGILGGSHFMGMVNPDANTGNIAGYASTISSESWVKLPPYSPKPFPSAWNSMFEAGVMAQELAHNLGRKHVNCGGPSNVDNSYPYNTGTLSSIPPQTPETLHFGFDTKTRTAISPNSTRDFMSYCGPTWTSDYTWKAILGEFVAAFAAAGAAPAAPDFSLIVSAEGTVIASGIVNVADDTGSLSYAKVVPEGSVSAGLLNKWMTYASSPHTEVSAAAPEHGSEPHQPNAASYHLRLLGPGGNQVADQAVVLSAIDDHTANVDMRIFAATFPAPAQPVAKVQFMGDDKVIDEISVGANAPVVQVTAPVTGATVTNQLTINWQAADPDPNDAMLFTIWYSPDNFTSFYPIANNVPMTPDLDNPGKFELSNQFTLNDLSALPGSATARVRVLASDGFNTGIADSGPFKLTNRPPVVYITDPNPGQVYDPQFPANLYGGATDAEDGLLTGDSLTWAIDNTEVATGTDALIAGMAPGVYSVTLTAADSAALSATRSAPLEIAPLSIPQTTAPTMDGFCNDPGYAAGTQVALAPYLNGDQASVHFQRTGSSLWACFTGLQKGDEDPIPVAGLRIDVNHDGVDPAQAGDFLFTVGEDGGIATFAGNGAGAFDQPGPGTLAAQISADVNESGPATTWNAELRIDLATLGGPNHLVGLAAGHYSLNDVGNDFVWPYAAQPVTPTTWAAAALGSQPIVVGINPYSATVGSPAIELHIEGDHFAPNAVVVFNGTTITPAVATAATTAATAAGIAAVDAITSTTFFTVNIPAGLLTSPGDLDVTVRNPGNLDANTMTFAVNNAAPVIASLTPDKADAQAAGFTLTVNGSGFLNGAIVAWDGVDLATTFGSAASLTANVPANLLLIGGFAAVTVRNPAPALADSNAVSFKIVGEGEITPPELWVPALKRN